VAAHFFVLFFSIMSNVTPPVAVAAYTAGALANADPNKTGFSALKIVIGTFLVPFVFVFDPSLLMQGSVSSILIAISTTLLGIFAFTSALQGWLLGRTNLLERGVGFASSILLMYPDILLSVVGFVLLTLLIVYRTIFNKKKLKIELENAK